jgi:hypothetical protein
MTDQSVIEVPHRHGLMGGITGQSIPGVHDRLVGHLGAFSTGR